MPICTVTSQGLLYSSSETLANMKFICSLQQPIQDYMYVLHHDLMKCCSMGFVINCHGTQVPGAILWTTEVLECLGQYYGHLGYSRAWGNMLWTTVVPGATILSIYSFIKSTCFDYSHKLLLLFSIKIYTLTHNCISKSHSTSAVCHHHWKK